MPLSTSVKRSRISLARRAQRHGAGDVGGGVEILAAAVDQVERAAGQRPVALGRGAVVGQGGVRAVRRDRVEARAAEQRILGPLRLQPRGRTHPRRGCRPAAGPSSQARKRATAAPSRRWASTAPCDLDRVLLRLGQHARVVGLDQLGTRRRQPLEEAHMGRARVDQHLAAARPELVQGREEAVDRLDGDGVGQARGPRGSLRGSTNQRQVPSPAEQGEAQAPAGCRGCRRRAC